MTHHLLDAFVFEERIHARALLGPSFGEPLLERCLPCEGLVCLARPADRLAHQIVTQAVLATERALSTPADVLAEALRPRELGNLRVPRMVRAVRLAPKDKTTK